MTPEVSVIIPTYNRAELLERLLTSLGDQTYPSDRFEVIVVDDGSNDHTPQVVERAKEKYKYSIAYIRREHRGLARSRNEGILAARGPIVTFLDSDAIACPEFVESYAEFHKAHAGEKIVGKGPVIHTHDFDLEDLKRPAALSDYSRAFYPGGNSSISRRALIDLGLFDEAFNEYGWEDIDMGLRLKRAGFKSQMVEGARLYHFRPRPSIEALDSILEKEAARGRMALVLYDKYPSFSVRLMLMMALPFFALDRLLVIGNWPKRSVGKKLLDLGQRLGWEWLVRFVIRMASIRAYMDGMREALGKRQRESRTGGEETV